MTETVGIVLALLAWALIFGPLFLLWWLPGHRELKALQRRSAARRARLGSAPDGSRRVSSR